MSTVDDLMWAVGKVYHDDNPELRSQMNLLLMEHDRNSHYKRYAEKEMEKVKLWNTIRAAIIRSGDEHWISQVEKAERGESLQ